jgi:lantibiotic modifying enzyme
MDKLEMANLDIEKFENMSRNNQINQGNEIQVQHFSRRSIMNPLV